ncbi:MAG: nucleotide sugar dehydrogenase [Dehalococcoidales bacterium]|nr:nucleotide sugar dehydrogenase [Dehalococcoidales bacterium]
MNEKNMNSEQYSQSPSGEKFTFPSMEDYPEEYERVSALVREQKSLGREIVVVMGLGFVGAVMAAVIANAEDDSGKPSKFVIGLQRPSIRSYWKIQVLNRGEAPLKAEDVKVEQYIRNCVLEKKTLIATYNEEVIKLADIVVVDVQCDYRKDSFGDVEDGGVEIDDLKAALHTIGKLVDPECLILIETTVPPGTTEYIAYPIIREKFTARGITTEPCLAHSYERVMPGLNYIDSIQNFWRVCSGINEKSRDRVVSLLNEVLNTRDFPLTVMDRPIESETAKIVENSYRATVLAFLDEWSLFAEKNGIDITKIVKAIQVRPTHNNIMFPGPGIGGYCLPKDGALGIWANHTIFGEKENIFTLTTAAININDTRSIHAVELLLEALTELNVEVNGSTVAVLGVSYREEVGDTRNSGSEIVVRKLAELGVNLKVHDPYVQSWPEIQQGNGRSKFFTNQEKLDGLRVNPNLNEVLAGVDAVMLAVRHQPYINLYPDEVVNRVLNDQKTSKKRTAIIDCFGILTDRQIHRYLELGCVVKGLGRGHIRTFTEKKE